MPRRDIFFCGTATEVTPIRSVDRIPVGDGSVGPITRRLQQRFLDVAAGSVEDAHGWLTLGEGESAASGRDSRATERAPETA